MKIQLQIALTIYFFLMADCLAYSQIAVNNTGNPPDSAAMLDISSSNRGFLIPRIDFNDRPDPAPAGLLIFVIANGPYGNNAFYFYDGTMWKTFSSIKFGIGDKIMGGTIIWVDPTNQHGLIAATSDAVLDPSLPAEYPWGCYGTFINGLQDIIGAGEANTDTVLAHCQEDGIPAKICKDLIVNGYSDWFLPSRNELIQMSLYYTLIEGLVVGAYYWSSTSHSANYAYAVPMEGTMSSFSHSKNLNYHVRCVRRF